MKTKFSFLFVAIIVFTINVKSQQPNSFKDSRDGKTYKTVKIGLQTWMAVNLNFETSNGSWCYDEDKNNCDKYGRLYDWEAAKNVCPSDWHLPSDKEWRLLLESVTENYPKTAIISGNNKLGFNALLSGVYRFSRFDDLDGSFAFWTSTEDNNKNYIISRIGGLGEGSNNIGKGQSPKNGYAASVRCIKSENEKVISNI